MALVKETVREAAKQAFAEGLKQADPDKGPAGGGRFAGRCGDCRHPLRNDHLHGRTRRPARGRPRDRHFRMYDKLITNP